MENKIIIAIAVVTLAILIGGTILVTKTGNRSQPKAEITKADLIGDARHSIGNPQAKVTVVEIADFQCPACAVANPHIKTILKEHKDDVYYVYRHFPLSQHQNAFLSAEASEAAGEQNKFWEMFDLLYEKQKDWQDLIKPVDKFTQYAKDLGLNGEQFKKALEEGKYKDVVQKDYESGTKIGIKATPSFYINGILYSGDFSQLKIAVEEQLKN